MPQARAGLTVVATLLLLLASPKASADGVPLPIVEVNGFIQPLVDEQVQVIDLDQLIDADEIDIQVLEQLIEVRQLQQAQIKVVVPARADPEPTRPPQPPLSPEEQARRAAVLAKLKVELADAERNVARIEALVKQGAANEAELKAAAENVAQIKKKIAEVSGTAPTPAVEEEPVKPKPPSDPEVIEFHLTDGTVLSGKLSAKSIDVDTKFGRLTVPITKLSELRPGLQSRPGMKEKVADLVRRLGGDDAGDRKTSAAELLAMGPGIRTELIPLIASPDAAKNAELKALVDKLNDLAGPDDFNIDPSKVTAMLDVIETVDFTMTGRIVPQEFTLASEYGQFTLPLAAVVRAHRGGGAGEEIRKALTLTEAEFAPRTFKSTGIQIEKGDKIQIRASGTLQMTRWGGNAVTTPDGAPNYGWYIVNKIPNGALCLRIGSGGEVIKAGSSFTVTAKQAGTLYLAIGMTDRFTRDNYRFPGEYKVQVKVEKK